MQEVTERDIRMPEFRDAKIEDLEFRSDGKIVRKDRWEAGIHKIRDVLGDRRREFEIDDIVKAVEALVESVPYHAHAKCDEGAGEPEAAALALGVDGHAVGEPGCVDR